jgi:hypothetical protein
MICNVIIIYKPENTCFFWPFGNDSPICHSSKDYPYYPIVYIKLYPMISSLYSQFLLVKLGLIASFPINGKSHLPGTPTVVCPGC